MFQEPLSSKGKSTMVGMNRKKTEDALSTKQGKEWDERGGVRSQLCMVLQAYKGYKSSPIILMPNSFSHTLYPVSLTPPAHHPKLPSH
jgi:hypothetical protein